MVSVSTVLMPPSNSAKVTSTICTAFLNALNPTSVCTLTKGLTLVSRLNSGLAMKLIGVVSRPR